jgi:anti-sigma factor RsiW
MSDLPENELFSAYIDGELTADEQAEVEQILAENPEARQLVDELRALSSNLQTLPSYKLDEDLAARVLRQAEREMLSEPATPLPRFHQVGSPETESTSWARRLLRPRNFAWSAVAVAVALVLMLGDLDNPNSGNNVAQNPGDSVIIEPLDVGTVDVVEQPATPSVVAVPEPVEPKPDVPDVVAPTPGPAMVAEKPTAPDPVKPEAGPKDRTELVILQCQLAEGRIGHEALAELFEQAGVPLDELAADTEGPVELTLTASQLNLVIAQLQSSKDQFTAVTYPSTAMRAGPRIPSAVGPGGSHPQDMTTAEGSNAKPQPKATFRVEGTITIQPKAAAPLANPAETTSAKGGASGAKIAAKARPVVTSRKPSIKDGHTYRVQFRIKPAQKPAKKTPAEK